MKSGFKIIKINELTEQTLPNIDLDESIIVQVGTMGCLVSVSGRDSLSLNYGNKSLSIRRSPINNVIRSINKVLD